MNYSTWQEFYQGDPQRAWSVLIAPLAFLLYRLLRGRPPGGVLPGAAGFVDGYAIVFAVETVLDAVVTGPVERWLGITGGPATAILIGFVLLGDFRVYLLLFGLIAVAAGRGWTAGVREAAAWTVVVPLAAWLLNTALHAAVAGANANSIWLIYETLFASVALALRARVVPARVPTAPPALRAFLDAALLYVAGYYLLWALADVLIQFGGLDAGWLLRVLPNQLYYALWVPLVFFAFFAPRR